jgi:hypothetical protein
MITSKLIKDGVPYFISNGRINFSFERTPIKTYFKSSGFENFDLSKLVQVGINIESSDLNLQKTKLRGKLNAYSSLMCNDISASGSKSNIDFKYGSSNFDGLVSSSETIIDETSNSVEDEVPQKYVGRLSRSRNVSFMPDKISLTTRRNFHIIGHLTQADVCFLTDFDQIKKDFDVVNKCLVTMGKSSLVL